MIEDNRNQSANEDDDFKLSRAVAIALAYPQEDIQQYPNATLEDVVHWMLNEVESKDRLKQTRAADLIYAQFGEQFTYINKNGNLAIRDEVLNSFEERTKTTVKWEYVKRYWRKSKEGDPPGRRVRD